MKKRIIWSNVDIDFAQWEKDLILYRKENNYDNPYDIEENDVWEFINESLDNQIDDERHNLDIKTDGRILLIADIGRWNGRVPGYRLLEGNIKNILYSNADCVEWYSDGHNIRATAYHHDGTNYYIYKEVREDRNIQRLLDAIYSGKEITTNMMKYYTKSLNHYVKDTYGW